MRALLYEKSYPLVGFSLFFLRAWEVPNIVPRSCMCADLTTGKECPWLWLGTISREATFSHLAGVTTLSSLQAPLLLSQARLASLSTGRNTLP